MSLEHATGEITNALTDDEYADRERCETVITAGIGSYVEVGEALYQIRERHLYRDRFVNFGEYVERMWGLSQSRGYQYIDAALIAAEVSTIVESAPDDSPLRLTPIPANEAQARELVPFKGKPEVAAAVLREAEEDGTVTAAKIREAAKAHAPKPKPPPKDKPSSSGDPIADRIAEKNAEREKAAAAAQAKADAAVLASAKADLEASDDAVAGMAENGKVRSALAHLLELDPITSATYCTDPDRRERRLAAVEQWCATHREALNSEGASLHVINGGA